MKQSVRALMARLGSLRSRSGRDPLGPAGERAAARMLRRAGYRVLARNVHVRFGELDLLCVAPDGATIVGVEVKSRRVGAGSPQGTPPPEASVHARKRHKVRSILRHLATSNGWDDRPVRMDAVAVEFVEHGRPVIRHFINVQG